MTALGCTLLRWMEIFPASRATGPEVGDVVGAARAGAVKTNPRRIKRDRINISYRHHSTCQSVGCAGGNLGRGGWGRLGGRGGRDNNRKTAVLFFVKSHPKQAHGDDREHGG